MDCFFLAQHVKLDKIAAIFPFIETLKLNDLILHFFSYVP